MSFQPIAITVADKGKHAFPRSTEPVRIGVAIAKGLARADASWQLTDSTGAVVAVQTTPLDSWVDGSVRWLLVEFQAHVAAGKETVYALKPSDLAGRSVGPMTITSADAVVVSTGVTSFELPRQGGGFLRDVRVNDQRVLRSTAIVAVDAQGVRHEFAVSSATVTHDGPLRSSVRLDGAFGAERGKAWLVGRVDVHFHAGLGSAAVELTVTNPRRAEHPNGTWDLGDAGSAMIRDLSIVMDWPDAGSAMLRASLAVGEPMTEAVQQISVYQDSSGGANWQHINHANRDGRVPASFCGYRAAWDGHSRTGSRATPSVSMGEGNSQRTVAIPRFWQMCPKKIEADRERCVIGMFPGEYGDVHELQGGERSTLKFTVAFGSDPVSATPLDWVRAPLSISADPDVYRSASVSTSLAVGPPATLSQYETLVDQAISGERAFTNRREVIDEYGWRNFGDLFADHEAVRQPLVSHYNNQYDALAGFLDRYVRTADRRWWELAADLALHVADIDLYHSHDDRSAYSGGHFWHTQHYQPAGTATHRAYSKRSGSSGGGPSAEHNYTSGLMQHYFLTGDARSRDAVIQLADWVINMDDGARSPFRFIDSGPTGLASGTRSIDFHGPGRGAGNSINALLDAHRLTGQARYLQKAEAVVVRCVHPDEDVAAMGLLDIENRWSYTVFLQVLGKYLEYRVERGLIDREFEYARQVLVRYAEWMSTNERPYLHTPEQLEFPTETWAAQDLRKAAVFEHAARYVTDEVKRASFLECAHRFVNESIAYLAASPTGHLTRPIILLLAYALQRPRHEGRADVAPVTDARWPAKPHFIAQRTRIVRRIKWAGAGLSAAALIVLVLWASWS